MAGSENRQRQTPVSFRCSDAELETIRARADRAGLTTAAFCRSLALDAPPPRAARRPVSDKREIARLIGHIGALSEKIDELRAANDGPPLLDAIHRDLSDICAAALLALGRGP